MIRDGSQLVSGDFTGPDRDRLQLLKTRRLPKTLATEHMRAASRDPVPLSDVLARVIRRWKPFATRRNSDLAKKTWQKVIGPEIARWSEVLGFKNGVLRVRVESTPLLAELDGFAKPGLVEELRSAGLPALHDISFSVGSLSKGHGTPDQLPVDEAGARKADEKTREGGSGARSPEKGERG